MKNVTKLFSMVIMIYTSSILEVVAQSYVTYNHDAAKTNQITVQEIGAGGNFKDKERWENYYGMFQCAIKAIYYAYIPNS